MRRIAMGLAVVGCAFAAGCGSSNPNASEAKDVVTRWMIAVAARNGEEACALLDGEGQAMIKRELKGFIKSLHLSSSCPALIGFVHDAIMTSKQRSEWGHAKQVSVSVSGDRVKVTASGGGDFWLTRAEGRWRISEIPLATG